jgi:hypothetical protein
MNSEEKIDEVLKLLKEEQKKVHVRMDHLESRLVAKMELHLRPRIDLHDLEWRLEYIMKMLLNAHELSESRHTQGMNEMVGLREEVVRIGRAVRNLLRRMMSPGRRPSVPS